MRRYKHVKSERCFMYTATVIFISNILIYVFKTFHFSCHHSRYNISNLVFSPIIEHFDFRLEIKFEWMNIPTQEYYLEMTHHSLMYICYMYILYHGLAHKVILIDFVNCKKIKQFRKKEYYVKNLFIIITIFFSYKK
ncbi:hypothetical protein KUTeg_019755 [Tegillarca granosa]|uniref:Uncharacterized protein n=1 Tax=Tegillarca granosa TaxID=220873 RepID=A0ABQ9EFG9_TEGGR|nr:hypothetical protein KUTeg_019755 [Tegillarca granosa]